MNLNDLVKEAYKTAKANGFHDVDDVLTPFAAEAKIASLVPILLELGDVIESIRKPNSDVLDAFYHSVSRMFSEVEKYACDGLHKSARSLLSQDYVEEYNCEINGSKTQVLAWLVLIISEVIEAIAAVMEDDRENFAEELAADVPLRVADLIGAINDIPNHAFGPIDMETAIQAKNMKNQQRGYKHGGKLI